MSQDGSSYEPLFELASPEIYRRNPFRVLGLALDASAKDVERIHRKRSMARKLGMDVHEERTTPLALSPPADDDQARAAIDRLRQPEARFLDELFWIWPADAGGAGDPAHDAFHAGEVETASKLWAEQSGRSPVASHNLAVLEHAQLLDEQRTSSGADPLSAARWRRVFSLWRTVCDEESFWELVTQRVRRLNDAKVREDVVERVRETLPFALLVISARLILDRVEKQAGAASATSVNRAEIENSGYPDVLVEAALQRAISPLRGRVTSFIDDATSRWDSEPQRADAHARAMVAHVTPLLSVIDAMLDEEDLVRAAVHDAVAEGVRQASITNGKKTNDWDACAALHVIAIDLAGGEALRARLTDELDVIKSNAKSGNDWYSPGYWSLPKEAVEALEAAHAKVESGDADGALEILAGLDASLGKPLRRCAAYALNIKAVRVLADAQSDEDSDAANMMQKLKRYAMVAKALGFAPPLPDPSSSSFSSLPQCPSCDSRFYSSWAQFELEGVTLFMCSDCRSKLANSESHRNNAMRRHVSTALRYLEFAHFMDSDDPGVAENLEHLKKQARELGSSSDGFEELRKQLGKVRISAQSVALDPSPEDQVCHFCHRNSSVASYAISVPMHGERKEAALLFGPGLEYSTANVMVPRCEPCHNAHLSLPGRLERWREARERAVSDDALPAFADAVPTARESEREASREANSARARVDAATKALKTAKQIGSACETCGRADQWREYYCARCDAGRSVPGRLPKGFWEFVGHVAVWGAVGNILIGWWTWGWGAWVVWLGALLLIGASGSYFDLQRVKNHLRRLKRVRERTLPQRRAYETKKASENLDARNAELAAAEERAAAAAREKTLAEERLEEAKRQAAEDFDRTNEEPSLGEGVSDESAYPEFSRIQALSDHGWRFGRTPGPDDKAALGPVNVRGLVGVDASEARAAVA